MPMPRKAGQPSLDGSASIESLRLFYEELIEYWELLTDVNNPTSDNLNEIHNFLRDFNRKVDNLTEQLTEEFKGDRCCGRFCKVMKEIKKTFEQSRCLSKFIKYYQLSQKRTLRLSDKDIDLRVQIGETFEKLSIPLGKALSQECIQSTNISQRTRRA